MAHADQTHRIALVTGADRGIGYEVCRQLAGKGLAVILTGRNEAAVENAATTLQREKLDVTPHTLDVTDPQAVARLEVSVRRRWGRLDVLVNNAAFYHDTEARNDVASVDTELVRTSMETNLLGPLRLIQTFLSLMRAHTYGRIVNVSTTMAQLASMTGGWPAYRFSKVALNALTRVLAAEVRDSNILVNSVSPGWVRTEMGGPDATRSVEEGAETILWLATLPDGGPTGGFFFDKKPIDW
jgi:NAD(P)-dependent dehydrogenase (short-subunit alcohol dehydrogenase family)